MFMLETETILFVEASKSLFILRKSHFDICRSALKSTDNSACLKIKTKLNFPRNAKKQGKEKEFRISRQIQMFVKHTALFWQKNG